MKLDYDGEDGDEPSPGEPKVSPALDAIRGLAWFSLFIIVLGSVALLAMRLGGPLR